MSNLASILTQLMAEKEIKSSELARKTGVGQPVIYRLMTGTTDNPQVLTLKPIAQFFNVGLDQLLGLAPLKDFKNLDKQTLHDINNKITTVKTIASVFVDIVPQLIEGYKQASTNKLTKKTIPAEILPLLTLNSTNLLKTINQLQDLLNINIGED